PGVQGHLHRPAQGLHRPAADGRPARQTRAAAADRRIGRPHPRPRLRPQTAAGHARGQLDRPGPLRELERHPPGHRIDPAADRRNRRTRRRRRHRQVRLRTEHPVPALLPRRGGRPRLRPLRTDHDRQEPLMSVLIATTLTPDLRTGPAAAKTLDGHADFALVPDGFDGLDGLEFASWLGPLTTHLGLVPEVRVTHLEPFHTATASATLDYA